MRLGRPALLSLSLLVALGAALAGCGDGSDGGPLVSQSGRSAQPGVKIEQGDFFFDPATFEAQADVPVKVELSNEGKASHTFTIDEFHLDQVVEPGEKFTIWFTPESAGTVAFYCRFHRARGMEGALTVSPGGPATPVGGGEPVEEASPEGGTEEE